MDYPSLKKVHSGDLTYYTDLKLEKSQGVKIAFTTRYGGASSKEFASLNFGHHVGDNPEDVKANLHRFAYCMGISPSNIITPFQIHKNDIVLVKEEGDAAIESLQQQANEGADAIVVCKSQVGALLCFADCVPVVIVSSSGNFAVVHAGWRGVMSDIVGDAYKLLRAQDNQACVDIVDSYQYNFYIGPYIHKECFETSKEIHDKFVSLYGKECSYMGNRINLSCAIIASLARCEVSKKRIADLNICTVCNDDDFFSYRSAGGKCGRHAAFAFRCV